MIRAWTPLVRPGISTFPMKHQILTIRLSLQPVFRFCRQIYTQPSRSGLKHPKYLIMDRAYGTRRVVQDLGATPVVPPRTTRWKPWSFDRQLYACRNEVERLFGRLKRYRRVVTRYDKLDVMFAGFIYVALIYEMIRNLV